MRTRPLQGGILGIGDQLHDARRLGRRHQAPAVCRHLGLHRAERVPAGAGSARGQKGRARRASSSNGESKGTDGMEWNRSRHGRRHTTRLCAPRDGSTEGHKERGIALLGRRRGKQPLLAAGSDQRTKRGELGGRLAVEGGQLRPRARRVRPSAGCARHENVTARRLGAARRQ